MDKPVELIPLVCLNCGLLIPAGIDEVAWSCSQCGQGLFLDDEQGLLPLDMHYTSSLPPGRKGLPYWVAEGRVTLQRETYGSSGRSAKEANTFWSEPRRFFVPAFTCPLETLLTRGVQLLLQPPQLQPGPAVPFEPVTLSLQDVRPAADFIVMAVEAARKDKLKRVEFSLDLAAPELWILPA
jgi:hypothetical protein